ncbi:hypothetical protein AVEN_105313-1 [Araneus ventricosus]|uniref:Uncharacterized protein n=1 Tax=Araneus ventricosus TaxID=182803 RepID=A0A4Y2MXW3_ARAVE|nr:hypothetical protein AVEN_105313-1 [Araneus ventricosus]
MHRLLSIPLVPYPKSLNHLYLLWMQLQIFKSVLLEFPDITNPSLIGKSVTHDTVKAKPRRLHSKLYDAVRAEFEFLLAKASFSIRPSKSPWSSRHVVLKSDSIVLPVRDYRKLNVVTEFDSYPMPTCMIFRTHCMVHLDLETLDQRFSFINCLSNIRRKRTCRSVDEIADQFLTRLNQTSEIRSDGPNGPYAPFGFESIKKQLWRNKQNDRPISDSEIKAVLSQLFKTDQWLPPAGHVSEDVTSHA